MRIWHLDLQQRWTVAAFERRTREYLPDLYRLARWLLSQPADAEDLVHDTYLKAFHAYPNAEFTGAEEYRSWLWRILANTFRDHYRRRHGRLRASMWSPDENVAANVVDLMPSPAPGPALALADRGVAEAVAAAMSQLPPEVRLAVALFFAEDLSYREIADIMDCPIASVTARLSRGRQMLSRQLRTYAEIMETKEPRSEGATVIEFHRARRS